MRAFFYRAASVQPLIQSKLCVALICSHRLRREMERCTKKVHHQLELNVNAGLLLLLRSALANGTKRVCLARDLICSLVEYFP